MSCEDYTPPHVEQLHGPDPTAGSDCAIAVAKMAIRFGTCGQLDPGMDAIREQAGLDTPNPPGSNDYSTTMDEYVRCLNSYDDEAQRAGFKGVSAMEHERGQWENDDQGLAPTIRREEHWCCVFVDYGVVQDREPAKTGDKSFRGAHAVGVYGFKSADETDDGKAKCKVYDPLNDGRRDEIPKGPVWWLMSTMRDAADAYAGGGEGTATWTATGRSERQDDAPEPEPPDPCAQAMTASRELLGEARSWLYAHRGGAADELFDRISDYLGGNREGLGITVHSGVKPDGWGE